VVLRGPNSSNRWHSAPLSRRRPIIQPGDRRKGSGVTRDDATQGAAHPYGVARPRVFGSVECGPAKRGRSVDCTDGSSSTSCRDGRPISTGRHERGRPLPPQRA